MNSEHKACTVPIPVPAEDLARLKEMRLKALPDLPEREQGYELGSLDYWAKDIPKEQLLPVLSQAVHDRRPLFAARGIKALGILFSQELPYDLLLGRLRELHEEWADYPAHVNDEAYMHRWKSGYDSLEEWIVHLLTNTSSRQLLPIQKKALEDCITDDCRTRLGTRVREAAQHGITASQ